MKLLRWVICGFGFHRPGAELFRRVLPPVEVTQRPDLRGICAWESVGRECRDCEAVIA